MYFGWWKRLQLSNEAFSFEVFKGGSYAVADIPDALTGTATYSGTAVGQYAIYQPLGIQSETGAFTANAVLTADFGAADAEGTLSGRVTNFSNAGDWSLTLMEQDISGGAVARPGDPVANPSVSWTIAGNSENGGSWDADFYSDVTPYVAHIPRRRRRHIRREIRRCRTPHRGLRGALPDLDMPPQLNAPALM